MMFGITTALDLCRDQTLGQCVSHYTAGSAFIGYAIVMVVLVHTGDQILSLKGFGIGRDMLDGMVMAVAVSPRQSLKELGFGVVFPRRKPRSRLERV